MLRAFPMSLTGAASHWLRRKPSGLIKTWEDLKAKFLSTYCPPARTTKKMEEINNFQQEPDETLYQAWERFKELLMKCPRYYLTKMQEVILFYNGLEVSTRQILDSKSVIPTKTAADAKVAIQEMAKYSQKWHNRTSRKRKQIFKPRQAIVPLPSRLYEECSDERKGSYGLKDLDTYSIGSTLRNDSFTKKEKDPRSFTLPCYINNVGFEKTLADLEASISVMPLSTNLNLELRRNQVDDLEPTIKEDEVINKPMIDIVKARSGFIGGLNDYPSECDFDRRIHIDCAYNLQFSCMIGFEYVHANFLLILSITVMSKKFYNTIMKDKIEFKRRNELGNFVNVPVFIGNFYVITDFAGVEDMDPYLDEGIGDVIVGEPFFKASCVEAKRFDGIITICDRDDSVTYQIVRENLRFKHLTNEKCNKVPPLLKVSKQGKKALDDDDDCVNGRIA
nr:hypothetical protein [Tanacetum cinerariifolium]